MERDRWLKRVGLVGVAPLAAASLFGGVILAQAQDSGSSGSGTPTAQTQQADDHAAEMDAYIAALAKNLGVSEQVLRDALKTTALQQLDQQVADGKIDATRAAEIRTQIENGQAPLFGIGGRGGPGGPGGHGPGGPGGDHRGGPGMVDDQALATFLGITTDQLHTELQGGSTLAQVAANHGKTRDQLKAFLIQQYNAHEDQEVAAGQETADQAAKEKADFAANIDARIDGQRPARPGQPPAGN